MHIDIQSRGFTLTPALRAHVDRKLRLALGATRPEVLRASVRLADANGPRGGSDMHCRIRVSLAGAPDIVVEDTETDLYVAIERAADRAGRTLVRRLTRRSEKRAIGADRWGNSQERAFTSDGTEADERIGSGRWGEPGGFVPVRSRRILNGGADERI